MDAGLDKILRDQGNTAVKLFSFWAVAAAEALRATLAWCMAVLSRVVTMSMKGRFCSLNGNWCRSIDRYGC